MKITEVKTEILHHKVRNLSYVQLKLLLLQRLSCRNRAQCLLRLCPPFTLTEHWQEQTLQLIFQT